ncbi:MAG: FGGY-family carbohydrate kinase, partial [Pseudomonadota bacterium]
PLQMLPEVCDCAADFGVTDRLGGATPIFGVAGDQQAATIGNACFEPGMLKSTYGTGCFALLNTGDAPVTSQNRLLTTVAYQLDGKPTYALEGSIFIAGAVVQWLRDGLGIIQTASETEALVTDAQDGAIIVPAFTGLGAPYWNPDCRGAVYGITRDTGPAEMARAALESIGYQTRDLWEAMMADWPGASDAVLRVDGGLSANDWAMQFLSDMLGAPVDRPAGVETTALGAAWLAGMRAGVYPDRAGFAATWARDVQFTPSMDAETRDARYARWSRAVQATMSV